MTNAGRGDEEWSIEEKAAHILATGFGYGSGWTHRYFFGKPQAWRPVREGLGGIVPRASQYAGNDKTPAATEGMHVARETETLELAHRAIHPRKLPKWVERLPDSQRNAVMAWSAEHPLTGGGTRRVREFEHWQTSRTYVCVPKVRSGADAAAALGMADLPGPLRAVLEMYALQRLEHADLVIRCLVACGPSPEIARDALIRWLWPELVPTLGESAKARHMRKADYCHAVGNAGHRLHDWLHRASAAYLRAYGIGNPTARILGVIVRGEQSRRPAVSTLAGRERIAA